MGSDQNPQSSPRQGTKITEMWVLLASLVISGVGALAVDNETNVEDGNSTSNGTDLSIRGGIVGLFDTITDLTKGVGGLFGQFEEGFHKIQPVNNTKVVEANTTSNTTEPQSHGSSIIVGLFKTLKGLTKDVSTLVGGVEDELTNRRQDVVDLAEQVEDEVQDLGDAIKNWVGSLEEGVKNITWSFNRTNAAGEMVQVANFTSSIKISSLEDHKMEEEETLVEDIPIIE